MRGHDRPTLRILRVGSARAVPCNGAILDFRIMRPLNLQAPGKHQSITIDVIDHLAVLHGELTGVPGADPHLTVANDQSVECHIPGCAKRKDPTNATAIHDGGVSREDSL